MRIITLQTIELMAAGIALDLPMTLDVEFGTIDVNTELIHAWITPRPPYCDRGRWQLNAESKDETKLCIDWADGFPRYYFGAEALLSELVAWLKARKQFDEKSDSETD